MNIIQRWKNSAQLCNAEQTVTLCIGPDKTGSSMIDVNIQEAAWSRILWEYYFYYDVGGNPLH